METLTIVLVAILVMVLLFAAGYCGYVWLEARRRAGKAQAEAEQVRQATAASWVTLMQEKKSRGLRAQLPVHSQAIQRNWLAKNAAGIPPPHKTLGKRVLKRDERYAAGPAIREDAEDEWPHEPQPRLPPYVPPEQRTQPEPQVSLDVGRGVARMTLRPAGSPPPTPRAARRDSESSGQAADTTGGGVQLDIESGSASYHATE